MTLARFTAPSPYFETAVDLNGVPSFVKEIPLDLVSPKPALDLSPQPNGRISVFETNPAPGAGSDLIEYDAQWHEVARHRTVGLTNTDSHDGIVLPDGTVWLMAYEPPRNGLLLTVIQRIDPDGQVGFEWNSRPYVDDSVSNYAASQSM